MSSCPWRLFPRLYHCDSFLQLVFKADFDLFLLTSLVSVSFSKFTVEESFHILSVSMQITWPIQLSYALITM